MGEKQVPADVHSKSIDLITVNIDFNDRLSSLYQCISVLFYIMYMCLRIFYLYSMKRVDQLVYQQKKEHHFCGEFFSSFALVWFIVI